MEHKAKLIPAEQFGASLLRPHRVAEKRGDSRQARKLASSIHVSSGGVIMLGADAAAQKQRAEAAKATAQQAVKGPVGRLPPTDPPLTADQIRQRNAVQTAPAAKESLALKWWQITLIVAGSVVFLVCMYFLYRAVVPRAKSDPTPEPQQA